MKHTILFLLLSLIIISCSNSNKNKQGNQEIPKQKTVVITNDMENASAVIPSWFNEKTVITMPAPAKAHSGEFVSKVDKDNIYSYAYQDYIRNINNVPPYKVFVNGWVYITEPNEEAIIALDISDNTSTILWRPFPLKDQLKNLNEWTEFNAEFTIGQPVTVDQQLKIFAFGGNKTAYFDDFKITFEY
jgi:hypothetical protein